MTHPHAHSLVQEIAHDSYTEAPTQPFLDHAFLLCSSEATSLPDWMLSLSFLSLEFTIYVSISQNIGSSLSFLA